MELFDTNGLRRLLLVFGSHVSDQRRGNMIVFGLSLEIDCWQWPIKRAKQEGAPCVKNLQASLFCPVSFPPANAPKENGGTLSFSIPPDISLVDFVVLLHH